MEKIQLIHPEGKKAISMDKTKYYALRNTFLESLKAKNPATFDELLADVIAKLKIENIQIAGVIKWNLFWVTLDMEAKNELKKDKSTSPYKYSPI